MASRLSLRRRASAAMPQVAPGPSGLVPAALFDPKAGGSSQYDPTARLAELSRHYAQFPGAAPGGTGRTGVMSARGWSDVLERQQEYLRLQDFLEGGRGIDVRAGGAPASTTRTLAPATGESNRRGFGHTARAGGQDIRKAYEALQRSR